MNDECRKGTKARYMRDASQVQAMCLGGDWEVQARYMRSTWEVHAWDKPGYCDSVLMGLGGTECLEPWPSVGFAGSCALC